VILPALLLVECYVHNEGVSRPPAKARLVKLIISSRVRMELIGGGGKAHCRHASTTEEIYGL
jgi:hypothetical protein